MDDHPQIWQPLTGMPDSAAGWGNPLYRDLERQWHDLRARMTPGEAADRFIEAWLDERNRAFAIETGEIEGLYVQARRHRAVDRGRFSRRGGCPYGRGYGDRI